MNEFYKNLIKKFLFIFLFFILVNNLILLYGETNNWAVWKGVDQNGISQEKDWTPEALNEPLKVNWKINVGCGYSSVSIMGDYIYTMGYNLDTGENVIYCLDLKSGKKIWKDSYKCSEGQYKGPKCTPVIDGASVYTLSQDGNLLCNSIKDGTLLWRKNLVEDFGAQIPTWGFAGSVRIEGDLAIVNAGKSGMAFNKKTGNFVWGTPGTGNYSTPKTFKDNGILYLSIYGKEDLYTVNVKDGKIIWEYPWDSKFNIIAADPYIYDKKVFVSSGYGYGCLLLDISKSKPKELWKNKNMGTHFSTVVIIDNYIYGINGNAGSNGELKCLDINTGNVKWSKEVGFGSLISANGYLIVLNEKGTVYIAKVDPNKYKEISKKENILNKLCWTTPVLCRGNLYLRNDKGDIISIDLRKAQ